MAALEVSIVVPYTGEPWATWAHERAIPSATALHVPVYIGQGNTVAEARNNGLDQVTTPWVIHLDADDELPPGYLDAMATGTADVRAPSVSWENGGRWSPPDVPKVWGHNHDECVAGCLPGGNWVIIGAAVRTELAQRVRWQEWPIYEDWAMWLGCYRLGATFETIRSAVYMAHSKRGGRNSSLPLQDRNRVHHEIVRSVLG